MVAGEACREVRIVRAAGGRADGFYGWAYYGVGGPIGAVYGPGADEHGRWVCYQNFRLEGRPRRYAGSTIAELARDIDERF